MTKPHLNPALPSSRHVPSPFPRHAPVSHALFAHLLPRCAWGGTASSASFSCALPIIVCELQNLATPQILPPDALRQIFNVADRPLHLTAPHRNTVPVSGSPLMHALECMAIFIRRGWLAAKKVRTDGFGSDRMLRR